MELKLLIIDHHDAITKPLALEGERLGCTVFVATDGPTGDRALKEFDPDVVVAHMRNAGDLVWWNAAEITGRRYIIFVHDDTDSEFMSASLDSGADALLPKNLFSPALFSAYLKVATKRLHLSQQKVYIPTLNLALDTENLRAEVGALNAHLTSSEFRVLRVLASQAGKVVARAEIQMRVFNKKFENRTLDVFVCTLRKKIRSLGLDIEAARGAGYRLCTRARPKAQAVS